MRGDTAMGRGGGPSCQLTFVDEGLQVAMRHRPSSFRVSSHRCRGSQAAPLRHWPRLLATPLLALILLAAASSVVSAEFDDGQGGDGGGSNSGTGTMTYNCQYTFSGTAMTFRYCLALDGGKSFLAWNAESATSAIVFFQGTPDEPYGWAGWAVSPYGNMPGSYALIGYGSSDGSTGVRLYSLPSYAAVPLALTSTSTPLLSVSPGSMRVEFLNGGSTVQTMANVTSATNQTVKIIWKGGRVADFVSGSLSQHADSSRLSVDVNFATGTAGGATAGADNSDVKKAHAWLAGLGYGVLLPLGALMARHLKAFLDPAWFYAHASLQTLGYLLGASGWGLGIWLYQQHTAVLLSDHQTHFAVGTAVFCLSTLQILTPLLKPQKTEGTRLYWNLAHWTLGYTAIVLAVINVFIGFDMLLEEVDVSPGWRAAYIAFLCLYGLAFVVLEAITWRLYLKRESHHPSMSYERQDKQGDMGL